MTHRHTHTHRQTDRQTENFAVKQTSRCNPLTTPCRTSTYRQPTDVDEVRQEKRARLARKHGPAGLRGICLCRGVVSPLCRGVVSSLSTSRYPRGRLCGSVVVLSRSGVASSLSTSRYPPVRVGARTGGVWFCFVCEWNGALSLLVARAPGSPPPTMRPPRPRCPG